MAKNSQGAAAADSPPLEAANNTGELEVLRDLIFGNQARDITKRISDLDDRLVTVRRDLAGDLDARSQAVAKTAADQTATLRKEVTGRLDKEVQVLGERIDQLAADLNELLQTTRQTLETRLDRMQQEHNNRLRMLEEESRGRDDDLRSELLTISAWLEDKKASRHDLGQMLEEIGQRLQARAQTAAAGETEQ